VAVLQTLAAASSSSGGEVSLGSGLVFAGGVIAALGAVVASAITARAAEKRLGKSLQEERNREHQRLDAERERLRRQLEHERKLAWRADASVAMERVARLLEQNLDRLGPIADCYVNGEDASLSSLEDLDARSAELKEEVAVLSIRFGVESQVVKSMRRLVGVMDEALPWPEELPLSEERREQIKQARKKAPAALRSFLDEAHNAFEASNRVEG
jgi:hypothetical protein